ncbi:LamG-like jellyroll fold domain-containing protein (plasmid) [Streptomyces sp. BI20]|uniref:LamG-like jellyroll fold domain-containing protein n=1 Tax=Streptomyces sp. BI20 TaxID=3403460 RepID=UPI003C757F5B
MPSERPAGNRLKTYGERTYTHTTLVRHQGTLISFALDDERRLYYSVLDLDGKTTAPAHDDDGIGHADLDVRHWADDPRPLPFPGEITRAGAAAIGAETMPRVRLGGRVELAPGEVVPDAEIDPHRSGTGRLTANAPFQVVSDGRHVFVFRQAVPAGHADAVHRTAEGELTGATTTGGATNATVAASALLCDRFVLAGPELLPVREVRYRRSRHRSRPATAKDTLGTSDMNDRPFHEPTLELAFVGTGTEGRFAVLTLPTIIADTRRWQFFVHNASSGRIDAINVGQGADGLFDTQGEQLWTSPDPAYRDAVLEREPGECPFTREPLVPVQPEPDFAESALKLTGATGKPYAEGAAPAGLGTGAYTIEAWVRPDTAGGTVLATGTAGIALSVTEAGALSLAHGEASLTSPDGAVPADTYTHLTAVYDGTSATLLVNGEEIAGAQPLAKLTTAGAKLFLGARSATTGHFAGIVDEVRVWSRARLLPRIAQSRARRLIGDEPGLAAYFRMDEAGGTRVHDQGPRAGHATLKGAGHRWVSSEAPIADSPGIRRDSFAVTGRTVGGGLSAALYQQQEQGTTGEGTVRPLKRQARVVLSWLSNATGDTAGAAGRIAALDLAIGRDGRLAQLPDQLDLPVVGSEVETVDPAEENRLKAELVTLRAELAEAEAGKRALDADVKKPGRVTAELKAAFGQTTALAATKAGTRECHVYTSSSTLDALGMNRVVAFDPAGIGSPPPDDGGPVSVFHHLTVTKGATAGTFTPVLAGGTAPSTAREAKWSFVFTEAEAPKTRETSSLTAMLLSAPSAPAMGTLKSVAANKNLKAGADEKSTVLGDGGDLRFEPSSGVMGDEAAGSSLHGSRYRPRSILSHYQDLDFSGYLRRSGTSLTLTTGHMSVIGPLSEDTSVTFHLVPTTPSGAAETAAVARVNAALARLAALAGKEAALAKWNEDIQRLGTAIETKENRLGQITDGTKGRSTKSLPMVSLGQDRLGLGWSGALLGFTNATGAPFLAPGGTGHLGLYHRDDQGRLSGVFYDTNVDRSSKRLTATDDTEVLLTARDAGVDLADVTITVAPSVPAVPGLCTLTLTLRAKAADPGKNADGTARPIVPGAVLDTETWNLLPRSAESLAAALNGRRSVPVSVGTVGSVKEDVLTLTAGAAVPLTAGALVTVGGQALAVAADVDTDATEIRLHLPTPAPTLAADAPVHAVSHTPTLVSHTRPGGHARYGSRYVTASLANKAGTIIGAVTDQSAAEAGTGRLPSWWSDLPGRALTFAADTTPPTLPAGDTHLSSARLTDNLTVEAWLKPSAGTGTDAARRIVHVNTGTAAADSRFTLALGAATTVGARTLLAGVGNRFVTSTATVPVDRWTHVAAAFEQSWALEFGNGTYAEAAHAADLNAGRDLTLEVFLRTTSLTKAQGVLSKGRIDDGRGRRVPYQLGIGTDGKLVFSFEGRDGARVTATSTKGVTANTFHRIGVVRKLGDSRQEKKGTKVVKATVDGRATDLTIDTIEALLVNRWSEISFHIDGEDAGTVRYDDAPDLSHPGPLEIGRTRRGSTTESFTGQISEVRIWNVARTGNDLGADLPPAPETGGGRPETEPASIEAGARPEGLVAHWRFEENEGNTARDDSGNHPVRLHGPRWTKNPDPKGSRFRLYVDGRATEAAATAAADAPAAGEYGPAQITLGARTGTGTGAAATVERYQGVLEEVRVWHTARTEEQILDNMFGRLTGEAADLIAHWPFDDESTTADATTLRDHGPRALHLGLAADEATRPVPLMSTAPISSEAPEVRPVFVTGENRFVQTVTGVPAVGEYADLQRLADRSTRGVLKRAYAYVQGGTWNLITGHKLGDLVSEWVGQAQFAPQLMGFIEGAPPIPAENLIMTRRPGSQTYINATNIEFKQTDSEVQTLSSGGEHTVDRSLAIKLSTGGGPDTLMITAPLGFGTAAPIVETDFDVEGGVNLEFAYGWGSETTVAQGTETDRSTTVGLSGGWETEPADQDGKQRQIDNGGRRFEPSNAGYALVQSETADVYALRVAHSGAVVSYRMLPNPDIPRDWNLIRFEMNPLYTKQGTLDGRAGYELEPKANAADADRWKLRTDPVYGANAAQYGEYSYYKPSEAYRLKRRIVEDQQRRQAHYAAVDSRTPFNPFGDPVAEQARELVSRFTGPIPGPGGASEKQRQADAAGLARRDIVNTYVWSADGGFFAESTGTTDVVTETTTGSYHFNGSASVGLSTDFEIFGVGVGFQIDSALGGSITRSRAASKEATRSFSLDVTVDTPGDTQKYDADLNPVFDDEGKAVTIPGRVDAYRFMTFYLDSDRTNFEDFYNKVVDQTWLDSGNRDALALKQARQSAHQPPCWRIMHRVTFVSRTLPPLEEEAGGVLEKAMRTADVASNYELVRRLDPYVDPAVTDRDELRRQVETGIRQALPDLAPHRETIVNLFADYRGLS